MRSGISELKLTLKHRNGDGWGTLLAKDRMISPVNT